MIATRHRELGLTDAEYDLIVEKLDREPNEVELAVFSLMWSEHCGYKHSRRLLKTLPVEGGRLVLGPGENAGAVDVGNGMACAFKVESHNHPSAVEPFQGAATGVGGILRDVFAIGARPIAILDSLRFGEPSSARSRYLLEHAVAGIGHYGNSIGVATVGGEIYFEGPYEQNCLINAMCVGLIETDKLIKSAAAGVGNVVVLFGARTGRDGIGGASVLASAELGDEDGAKRPTVQIGDPFEESKLLECSLELLDAGLLVALQDLGAAGLTSSSSEMAAKGGLGIDLDVRRVPLREADMEPFEIMISESQERMLCVVEPEKVDDVLALCAKWEVNATAIGEVTATDRLRVFDGDALVGDLPVTALVDECPAYDLEPLEAARPIYPSPPRTLPDGLDAGGTLLALLGSANLASRRWAFEQYDCVVGSRTVRRPEQADAAVLMLDHGGADRRLDRRQRPARGGRPLPRRGRGRARVLGQPRLRRRRAARPHQLPQLRQPREAAHRLPAHARGGRARRRLPRARRAGRRRQRLALQRGRRGPDLPDARWSAWSASCPTRRAPAASASLPRATPWRSSRLLGALGDRLGARQAARRATRGRAAGRRPRRAEGAARGGPPGGALGRAALGARRRRGRRRRRAGRVLHRRRARRPRGASTARCSPRARARSSSPARPRRSRASARRRG